QAAFTLKAGQVSDILTTPAGLHLLKVDQIVAPRPRTLDEKIRQPGPAQSADGSTGGEAAEISVAEFGKNVLRNERLSRALQAWVDDLKQKALIVKIDEEPAKP